MNVSRIPGLVLAAFTMCLVASPYARPIACDMAQREQQGVVHAHDAQADSTGAVLSSRDDARACHDMSACCVANLAPTLDGDDGLAHRPPTLAVLPLVVHRIAAKSTAPLTPPPRI